MKNNLYYLTRLIITLLVFSACQKDMEINQSINSNEKLLEFKDSREFVETLQLVNSLTYNEYKKWLRSHDNFTSVYEILLKVSQESEQAFETQEKTHIPVHTKYLPSIQSNSDLFIVKDDGTYELNLPDHRLTYVLNKNRMVKIGRNIVQYSLHDTKTIIEKSHKTNQIQLLQVSTKSNPTIGLYVAPVIDHSKKITGAKIAEYWDIRECVGHSNDSPYSRKFFLKETNRQYPVSFDEGKPKYTYSLSLSMEVYKRGNFGFWTSTQSPDQKIRGTVKIEGDFSNLSGCQVMGGITNPWNMINGETINYSRKNMGIPISMYTVNLFDFTDYSCDPGITPFDRQIRLSSSSIHIGEWDRGSTCTIQQ